MTSAGILITGSSGFVGTALVKRIKAQGGLGAVMVRHRDGSINPPAGYDLSGGAHNQNFTPMVVIHLAARAHLIHEVSKDPLAEYRKINVFQTLEFARKCATDGVKRFIYISSVKVNGESTQLNRPFTSSCPPRPEDAYGISKLEAEDQLRALAKTTGLEVVIIRPPLVYGHGVKANFLTLMKCLEFGIPVPLGAVRNRRSLIYIENLVDFILACVDHPGAANRIFLVSDGDDLSTPDMLRRMGRSLGRPVHLMSLPPRLLKIAAAMIGKRSIAMRLCDSLQVDISDARIFLGWTPPISVDEGFRRTAAWFAEHRRMHR